jgi:hypothetical protein
MFRAEKQLAQEINALIRKAEILDAQEDRRYGKNNRGSDLPDELRRRKVRWTGFSGQAPSLTSEAGYRP